MTGRLLARFGSIAWRSLAALSISPRLPPCLPSRYQLFPISPHHPLAHVTPSRPLRPSSRHLTTHAGEGMELKELMSRVEGWLRPDLAASWDNVGLLVEPCPPHSVQRLLLTNDLTEEVLAEAISNKTNMILSYHPPIFKPLKRLTQRSWKERCILGCVEHRIAVYAPHTILDCLQGGVTDWLIEPFGGSPEPLQPSLVSGCHDYSVSAVVPVAAVTPARHTELAQLCAATASTLHHIRNPTSESGDEGETVSLRMSCKQGALAQIIALLSRIQGASDSLQVTQLAKVPLEGCGEGRITRLAEPLSLREAVRRTKEHLGLKYLRLACAPGKTLDSPVSSVAVCAGAGTSVLAGQRADLYVTGEMSHHDVLDATHRGASVILCEHTNTERGFLPLLALRLRALLGDLVIVEVSTVDKDPLKIF